MRIVSLTLLVLSFLSLGFACKPKRPPEASRYFSVSAPNAQTPTSVLQPGENPVAATGGTSLDVRFDGVLGLVGARLPSSAKLGDKIQLRTWWRFDDVLSQEDARGLQMFVHAQVPGAELTQAQADHPLASGRLALDDLMLGDLVEDVTMLSVPSSLAADRLEIYVGLYQGKKRWSATSRQASVADNRVHLGTLLIQDGPPLLPKATARKRQGQIVIDGVLDEPDWQNAMELGPFYAHDGKRKVKNQTHARLMWDETHLYVAFICDDDDIHTPYQNRDDPLYESEAVEIFIDADGDGDEYVELQAAANDVHFDAAFAGGRRKNFDTSYDVNYETKATLQGTLNDSGDIDQAWVSEWKIPLAELRDVQTPPAPGTSWRVNLFRLDRKRKGERVVGTEATAWSSPLSGDFHHLKRFGTLEFAL